MSITKFNLDEEGDKEIKEERVGRIRMGRVSVMG